MRAIKEATMKRLLLATVGAVLFVLPTFAADVPQPPPRPQIDAWSWTGFGVGGALGYDWGKSESSISVWGKTLSGDTSPAGLAYGGFIYAQKQYPNGWVPGVQVSLLALNADDTGAVTGSKYFTATKKDDFNSLLLAEFKLGYANLWKGWLPYGTVGVGCGTSKTTLASGSGSITSSNADNCGLAYGAGIDWAAYQTGFGVLVAGLKYVHVERGTVQTSFPIGGGVGISIPNKQKDDVLLFTISLLN